jgi:hypothetical protein
VSFKKATKKQSYLRLAIGGPSGSGKTYTSLAIGSALAQLRGGGLAVLDTEHGSASKYSDIFSFDVSELGTSDGLDYHPQNFINTIREAESAGYAVLIIDSISHAWMGQGGALSLVDQFARTSSRGGKDTFTAWSKVTPIQEGLITAIQSASLDIIVTARSKTDYEQGEDKKWRKVGLKWEQRDGLEYSFDVAGDMLPLNNELVITKTRCPVLTGKTFERPNGNLARILYQWLTVDADSLAASYWDAVRSEGLDHDHAKIGEKWARSRPDVSAAFQSALDRLRSSVKSEAQAQDQSTAETAE